MDWLRFLQCLFFVSLPQIGIAAAQLSDGEKLGDRSIAVTGDVLRPDSYAITESHPVTLREVLTSSGLAAESSTVTIFRHGRGQSRSTEIVERSSTDPGPIVQTGDIVAVRSLSESDAGVRPNAVIRIGHQVQVLSLQGEGVTLGDVLGYMQFPPQIATSLQKMPLSGAVGLAQLKSSDVICHGDIIFPNAEIGRIQNSSHGIVPVVSEWRSPPRFTNTPSQSPAEEIPSSQNSAGDLPSSFPEESAPVSTTDKELLLAPPADTASISPSAESSVSVAPLMQDTPGNNEASHMPVVSASLSRQTKQPVETVLQNAEQGSEDIEQLNESAPAPPAEVSAPQSTTAGIGVLQITLATLLLGAAAVMVFSIQRRSDTSDQIVAESETDKPSPTGSGLNTISEDYLYRRSDEAVSPANSEAFTSSQKTISETDTVETSANLVADGEWFSEDWRKSRTAPQLTSVALQGTPAANTDLTVASLPAGSATPAGLSSVVSETLNVERNEKQDSNQKVQGSSAYEDLNSLIENRLPVELSKADLPLRISIFGRPSGPRRLRIDAAHPAVPGPHTVSGVMKTKTAFQQTSARDAVRRNSSSAGMSSKNDSAPAEITAENDGRIESLDRALTFLQGQGDR